ncbi:glycosyltransferase [Marinobacter sp. LN3S78]|uniref:glycosyltransferase n=1 Tax=Marinobacter sp. LN3S78 TaxID=3382300 RepID=UPI00387AFAB7
MGSLKGKRIVMVSLIPDAGHLKSLFLILKNLEDAGAEIYVLVPDEAEIQARSFGFPYELIGPVVPEDGRQFLQVLSRSGRWKHVFFTHLEAQKRYFLTLTYNGLQHRRYIMEKLKGLGCDALLCDPHIFLEEYGLMATVLKVPLIVHEATGTLYRLQDRRAHLEKRSWSGELLERFALQFMPAWHYRFNKVFRRRRFKAWGDMSRFVNEHRASYSRARPGAVHRITTGTANIENKYLFGGAQNSDPFIRLGSLDPESDWGAGQSVMDWLSGCEDNSVVYLSFGTLASPPDRLVHRIINHIRLLGKRVLVAAGTGSEGTRRKWEDDSVRWVDWAPQASVLASPKVTVFISHMGATSYREALWFGKPVLGIPLLWDQFYCAWAAESLGVGRMIRTFRISDNDLHEVISDVLSNMGFVANARRLSEELKAESGDEHVVRFVNDVLATGDRSSDASRMVPPEHQPI